MVWQKAFYHSKLSVFIWTCSIQIDTWRFLKHFHESVSSKFFFIKILLKIHYSSFYCIDIFIGGIKEMLHKMPGALMLIKLVT